MQTANMIIRTLIVAVYIAIIINSKPILKGLKELATMMRFEDERN